MRPGNSVSCRSKWKDESQQPKERKSRDRSRKRAGGCDDDEEEDEEEAGAMADENKGENCSSAVKRTARELRLPISSEPLLSKKSAWAAWDTRAPIGIEAA